MSVGGALVNLVGNCVLVLLILRLWTYMDEFTGSYTQHMIDSGVCVSTALTPEQLRKTERRSAVTKQVHLKHCVII